MKADCSRFRPMAQKIAYNRIFRNFRQWKRYTGGLAQDITIYDLKNNSVDGVIPHTDYTDTFPMWHGNTIFFTSDRGPEHRLNIYSYDTGSKAGTTADEVHRFRLHVAEHGAGRNYF